MTTPLLSLRDVKISIRGRSIVERVSFDVEDATTVGLYGDSGSGKTTILHAICGLQDPAFQVSGDIRLRGEPIGHLAPDQRSHLGISIVLQDLGLFEDRSVFENVAYPLRRRKAPHSQIKARVDETLATMRIADLANRHPGQISGGQRQRVALARALVYKPSLLLLDEPLRGLQEDLRLEFLAFLRTIGNSGTTILFVTHDRMELDLVCDGVISIQTGRIREPEYRQSGRSLKALNRSQLLPHPTQAGQDIRTSALRLARAGDPASAIIPAEATEWRTLDDGRCAVLAVFASGYPRWIVFDREIPERSEQVSGPLQLYLLDQGEIS